MIAKSFRPEDQPPFSLEGCFNLSELTLDMERTSSCIVTTSVHILSTLDPTQCNRLECIRLVTSCVCQWFREESRTKFAQAWGDLDIVLSELTKAAVGMKGKGLTFVLVSAGGGTERGVYLSGGSGYQIYYLFFMSWGRCMLTTDEVTFGLPRTTPIPAPADRTV